MRLELKRSLWVCLFVFSVLLISGFAAKAQEQKTVFSNWGLPDTAQMQKLIDSLGKDEHINDDTALQAITRIQRQCMFINYRTGIGSSYYYIGLRYNEKGNYEKANQCLIASFPYWNNSEEGIKWRFHAYGEAACTFRMLGRQDESARFFYKALEIAEKNPKSQFKIERIYTNLGTVFMDNPKQWQEALYYFGKAEVIVRAKKDSVRLGTILFNKALCWNRIAESSRKKQDADTSKMLFLQMLSLGQQMKDTLLQYRALTRMTLPLFCPNSDSALAFIHMAERLMPGGDKAPYMRVVALRITGDVYARVKNYRQAIAYYQRATDEAKKFHMPTGQFMNENMAKFYAAEGRYDKAYEYQLIYSHEKDSTTNEKIQNDINEMNVRYKASEKDKDIAQKKLLIARQQRNLSHNNMWLAISVGSGLLLFTISMAMYRNVRHKQYQQKQQIEILEKQKEIELLKGMIRGEEKERTRMARELHDGIGGMLTTVNLSLNKVKKKQDDNSAGINDVQHMIGDIASEVRNTAHNLMPDILTIHGLEDALLQYCASINTSGALQVEIITSGQLNLLNKSAELLLYRITQELIQNVVKHARATLAVVQIIVHEGEVSLSVEDNGVGFDVAAKAIEGHGLQNLQHRIELLQGHLSVHSELGKGSTAYLHFNLEKLSTVF